MHGSRYTDLLRTEDGDTALREAGIDPDANPATAGLAAVMLQIPEARYLERVLPPDERGCDFAGRFDREDSARQAGFGPPPGSGGCDYPLGCEYCGDAEMRCPYERGGETA